MPYRSPGAPKGAKSFLKGKPIRYYRPKGSAAVRTLIDEGFQAFNAARLGEACRIFGDKMLSKQHDTTIALTIAGAMTPAGLGGCVIALMERGLIDFVISTGANLYHDLHETRGQHHYLGSAHADDAALAKDRIDRVYDTYASEEEFIANDNWIADFAATLAGGGCIVTTPGTRFEPEELFACVEAQRVNSIVIVGDAFARPMVDVLDPGGLVRSQVIENATGTLRLTVNGEDKSRKFAGQFVRK